MEIAIIVQVLDDFPDSNVSDDADDPLVYVRYMLALVIIDDVKRITDL
jgi:hypothetical protein